MGSGTAHIKALDRRAVAGVAQNRARDPELIERHVAVHDVPAGQAKSALQVQGREDHSAQDRGLEVGRPVIDRVDDQVGGLIPRVVPRAPVGKPRRELLAEQAGHMLAGRGQAVVEGRWDQHLDDRFSRPADNLRSRHAASM